MQATNAPAPGRVLISCDPECQVVAEHELRAAVPVLREMHWLEPGLAMANTGAGFDAFATAIERAGPIFIRHIAPVDLDVPLVAGEPDLATLREAAAGLAGRLDPAGTFSVQTRILGEGKLPYRRVVVNETLSTFLEGKTGAKMNAPAPDQVVSVLCTPSRGYLGVSRTDQNRSAWPGGMHRFKNEDGQISRSEHKLLEAISVFRLELPAPGRALDMGAAPGGWTHVLRDKGLQVVAVDPADLDPRLRGDAGVTHVRKQMQDYRAPEHSFDVLVNDMRMDPVDSVRLMVQSRSVLKPGGLVVVTLKLPESSSVDLRTLETVRALIARLAANYAIIGARRLYHNRSEVTVCGRAAG